MLTATKPLPIQLNWEFASHTSLHVDYTYARPRQDRASLVCNGSENTDEIGLRKQCEREKQRNETCVENARRHAASECSGSHSASFSKYAAQVRGGTNGYPAFSKQDTKHVKEPIPSTRLSRRYLLLGL